MKICDLVEPKELSLEEQREIVGGLGGFILGLFAGSIVDDGLDATASKYSASGIIEETDAIKGVKKGIEKSIGRGRNKH